MANDIPLPANSGGRVDVWRRLNALKAAGHSVALLCWTDAGRVEPPSTEVVKLLGSVCESVRILRITRGAVEVFRRLLQLWRWPSHVAARAVTAQGQGLDAWVEDFSPDVVLLDGLYGGAVAVQLSKHLGKPLWYRSHNIEHRYMAAQRRRETRLLRRMGLMANCLGLERFERSVIKRAVRVLDISQSDADFWRNEGAVHVEWLPTLVDQTFVDGLANLKIERKFDVLYFGNLNTPNNVEAVGWFVRKVLPRIGDPELRICVAGSRPSEAMREMLARDSRITLIENPEDMASVVAQGRVLVNPMLAGSGVNLKSVEMLFSDAALVSTSIGVAGLPVDAKSCFAVVDSPESFAAEIVSSLRHAPDLSYRKAARKAFSLDAVEKAFGGSICVDTGHC